MFVTTKRGSHRQPGNLKGDENGTTIWGFDKENGTKIRWLRKPAAPK